jgi:hypothetical protein
MATKYAKVNGVKFDDGPLGPANGGVAVVTFDTAQVYTGGTDTVSLGGGGYDGQVATTATLAGIMQTRRRDGKTVAITGVSATPTFAPGLQLAATNGPAIFATGAATAGGNVTLNLYSTITGTGGANITTAATSLDRDVQILVSYTAT